MDAMWFFCTYLCDADFQQTSAQMMENTLFFEIFCVGKSFREVSPVLLGARLQTGRRQLPRLSHRNASSPSQRRLGMTSDSDELEPTKKATCSFDIIGLPDAKKMELLLMLTWKLHSCRWKFQVPPSSSFFLVLLLPVLPGVVLAAARVGTILYFVQDSCNLDRRVEFLVVSNILYGCFQK